MQLTFHGGVLEVTGANYLVESGGKKILVDCGLHQGGSFSEKQNWERFAYNPAEIDAVFITHSHIDHIGLLPKLYKDGFRGKVFSTAPCRDFAELLLYDSQHILMQEAEKKRRPILYNEEEVASLMKLWEGGKYHQPVTIGNFTVTLHNAGHILGSSVILVSAKESGKETKVVFSGDLGNSPAPLIGDKELLPETDYCLIESTYGDRVHEDLQERREIIEDMIEDTVREKGVLMIPAFAMERTQQLIFEINQLVDEKRIVPAPVFIDSPLAIKLTDVYRRYSSYFSEETLMFMRKDADLLDFPGLKKTLTTEESKAINDVPPPKIIIAGSGMSHGGRILHHEQRYLPDPKSTLLVVGYQAKGSLGRQILDGAKEVKILGEKVAVNCRIKAIGGYSAHADQPQLLDWLRPQRKDLEKVFVIQGEEEASVALNGKIRDKLAVEAEIPEANKAYQL